MEQLPPQEEGGEEAENPAANIEGLFVRAEELRGEVDGALKSMENALAAQEPVLNHAQQAQESLQELRILFFSVVEHLKQLLEEQGTLRDESGVVLLKKVSALRAEGYYRIYNTNSFII